MHLLMTTFARLGAELWDTDATMVNPGPFILKAIGQDMLGQHYSIGYPALSHALLQRSETKIWELLSGKCEEDLAQLLQEKGPWDQTPLHVSTSWPQGMQLIFELAGKAIESVIDMKDDRGKTALDYAIRLREIDSIKTLITAGRADIKLESGLALRLQKLGRPSQAELSFLFRILADRRRQLHDFAVQTLGPSDRLRPRADSSKVDLVLQEDAWGIVQRLRATGVDIPRIFRPIRRGSTYHSLAAPFVEVLEALHQAGSNHTDVTYLGFSPLMTLLDRGLHSYEHMPFS